MIKGDVMDADALSAAMHGKDLVFANLAGDVDDQAARYVAAMEAAGLQRLMAINSLGIYDEVPGAFGEWTHKEIGAYLPPYQRAADLIEASSLDYTVVRAAWLQDADEIDYATTAKGDPFEGTEVSRMSVAAAVLAIFEDPSRWSKANIGLYKPGTAGSKPAFM